MCHPKEPLTPDDFMPGRKPKEEERTDNEVAEDFAAKFAFIAVPPSATINSNVVIKAECP
jgi:hypothetical protein